MDDWCLTWQVLQHCEAYHAAAGAHRKGFSDRGHRLLNRACILTPARAGLRDTSETRAHIKAPPSGTSWRNHPELWNKSREFCKTRQQGLRASET
ncbi:unnamed protein product [Lota lota]